jgi:hypothetical protein
VREKKKRKKEGRKMKGKEGREGGKEKSGRKEGGREKEEGRKEGKKGSHNKYMAMLGFEPRSAERMGTLSGLFFYLFT